MTNFKRWLAVALTLVCIVVLAVACVPPEADMPVEKEKAVKVGLHLVNTGAVAGTTEPHGRGQVDYLRYVNEELGGIEYKDPVTGKPERVMVDVVWSDNSLSIPRVLSDYERFKAAGITVMTIFPNSSAAAIGRKAERDGIYLFGSSSASYSPQMHPPSNFTASNINIVEQMGVMLKWFKDRWTEPRRPKVGVILMAGPFHKVCGEALPPYIEQIGIDSIGFEWLELAALDSSIELTRIMANNPDAIVMNHTIQVGATVIKDMDRLGFKGKTEFITAHSTTDAKLTPALTGDACEGVYSFRYASLVNEDLPGVKLARDSSQKYTGRDLSSGYLVGFGHTMVLVEGIKIALEKDGYQNMTGLAIKEAILQIKDFETAGIFPPITVDPEWPELSRSVKFLTFEGGEVKSVSDWFEPPVIREWMFGTQ